MLSINQHTKKKGGKLLKQENVENQQLYKDISFNPMDKTCYELLLIYFLDWIREKNVPSNNKTMYKLYNVLKILVAKCVKNLFIRPETLFPHVWWV